MFQIPDKYIKCAVCNSIPPLEIFSCDDLYNPHMVCDFCRINGNQFRCPVDKCGLFLTRNAVLERVIKDVERPCPYANIGCDVILDRAQMHDHLIENQCSFFQVKCPLGLFCGDGKEIGECGKSVSIRGFGSHLKDDHRFAPVPVPYSMQMDLPPRCDLLITMMAAGSARILEFDDKEFLLIGSIGRDLRDVEHFVLILIGTEKEAELYTWELTLMGHERSAMAGYTVKFEGPVAGLESMDIYQDITVPQQTLMRYSHQIVDGKDKVTRVLFGMDVNIMKSNASDRPRPQGVPVPPSPGAGVKGNDESDATSSPASGGSASEPTPGNSSSGSGDSSDNPQDSAGDAGDINHNKNASSSVVLAVAEDKETPTLTSATGSSSYSDRSDYHPDLGNSMLTLFGLYNRIREEGKRWEGGAGVKNQNKQRRVRFTRTESQYEEEFGTCPKKVRM